MSTLARLGKATQGFIERIIGPMVGREELAKAVGYRESAGPPSSVVPVFVGERLFDTTNSVWYVAHGTSSGNWARLESLTAPVAAGSALSLTAVSHHGKTILLDTAAGSTVTLPAASGSGARFRFQVSVLATSNSHIIKVANASDVMAGSITLSDTDTAGTTTAFSTAASSDTITLNRSTTGSVTRGEWVEVEDIATNLWAVRGCLSNTGTGATPFSATVS